MEFSSFSFDTLYYDNSANQIGCFFTPHIELIKIMSLLF